MGVWSSISLCHIEKRKSFSKPFISRNSSGKQILNVDSDSFSNTLHQDVQEFRIQESFPEISEEISLRMSCNVGVQEQEICPTNFEYSMGGNLKFYKEHLMQDYLENKSHVPEYLRRQRKISLQHSDNDSDPECLRYARKRHTPSNDDVITEEHDAELSFDDYSTFYEPEFLLDTKSQHALVKKKANATLKTRETNKNMDENKADENNKNTTASFENSMDKIVAQETKLWEETKIVPQETKASTLDNVDDIEEKYMFDYYPNKKKPEKQENTKHNDIRPDGETTKDNNESKQQENAFTCQNEFVIKKKEIVKRKSEICKVKQSSLHSSKKKLKEENLISSKNVLEASHTILTNVDKSSKENLSLLLKHANEIYDDTSSSAGKRKRKMKNKTNTEEDKKVAKEFYPESPIAEKHFFKTPCSTRHNSLEILNDDKDNREEFSCSKEKQLQQLKDAHLFSSSALQLQESYNKLPKQFQEMARRLSKKDEFPKSSDQDNSIQIFSCSSSTCSIISPRSPNARAISRTPSYKMPKTPSLSRHHPATYVTQHTSSRSRPSSRASSRAPSPTRENHERSSIRDFIEYTLKREAGNQFILNDTSTR